MEHVATLDFETYSELDIRDMGAAAYARHPSTEVLWAKYQLPDNPTIHSYHKGQEKPWPLINYVNQGGIVEAHNAIFEHEIYENATDWGKLPVSQVRCSMAKVLSAGLPGKLLKAAEALGADEQKDTEGKKLINLFSKPRKPTKKDPRTRITGNDKPLEFYNFGEYCAQDVRTEHSISSMLADLAGEELELFQLDFRANVQGVSIDIQLLESMEFIVNANKAEKQPLLPLLTGGQINTASQVAKIRAWLVEQGVDAPDLKGPTVDALQQREDLPDAVSKVLDIRQAIGGSAVTKIPKFKKWTADDGKIRGVLQYHGCHTGRWAGRGPQLHNLPNHGPEKVCPACNRISDTPKCLVCGAATVKGASWDQDTFIPLLNVRNLELVKQRFDSPAAAVAGCLRGLLIPSEGMEFISADFSAVEAVVTAFLAGEEWRMQAFREGKDIYLMGVSKMRGIPYEELVAHKTETGEHHPLRKKEGKPSELAFGFGGGVGAAARFNLFEGADEIKNNWRKASPSIVKLWYGLIDAAISAVQNPGSLFIYKGTKFLYLQNPDVLKIILISGRAIHYWNPRLEMVAGPYGDKLELSHMYPGDQGGKWYRRKIWHGILVENVVQATARDLLRYGIIQLDRAGYKYLLSVHDEVICEVPIGWGSVEELERLMSIMPPWAADWPVKAAGGWRGFRFRK